MSRRNRDEIEEEEDNEPEERKVGRMLGWVKRRDPLLYERIIEDKEAGKKSIADVVFEALRTRYLFLQTEAMNLNAAQLLGAFDFWDRVMNKAIDTVMNMFKFFYGKGLESYLTMVEMAKEKIQKEQVVESEPKLPSDIKVWLMYNMMNMVTAMVRNVQQVMIKAVQQSSGQKVEVPTIEMPNLMPIQPQSQSEKKVKIIELE